MKDISIIKAKIKSISPLHIGDDDGEILIDNNTNMAYLPATGVAGSFRAYLKAVGKDYKSLFGDQDGENSMMSSVYISDCFSPIVDFERRDGLKIDGAMGSSADGLKRDVLLLGEGLEFELCFEIHAESTKNKMESYKDMIYICLNALDKGYIRFGSKKSSGLGNFRLLNINEINYDLCKIEDYENYLKRNYVDWEDVSEKVRSIKLESPFITLTIEGQFTTPFIVKAPDRFEIEGPDNSNLRSGDDYIVPGTSFKGILRSRVEKIADYYDIVGFAKEMFGEIAGEKEKHRLSRVIVSESKIRDSVDSLYNRIRIDSFTGGVRKTALMQDVPVKGASRFNVMYKKSGDDNKDKCSVALLALALRDLGMEDLVIGGNSGIGRGRFKASAMVIEKDNCTIKIDFNNKKIEGEEILQECIECLKAYRGREADDVK